MYHTVGNLLVQYCLARQDFIEPFVHYAHTSQVTAKNWKAVVQSDAHNLKMDQEVDTLGSFGAHPSWEAFRLAGSRDKHLQWWMRLISFFVLPDNHG